MGLYSTFKTNADLERQGRWFDITSIVNKDGSHPGFKMARMHKNNPEYLAAIERVSKEMRQAIELDILNEEVASPIMRGVFVDTILLDWRNVFEEDEETIMAYSKHVADKLMTELPDLYLLLVDEAKKLGNFRDAEVAAVSEKSSRRSNKPSGNDAT